MEHHIPTQSTTDGRQYWMIVCSCGKQTSGGICEHVKEPSYFTMMSTPIVQNTNPPGIGTWTGYNYYDQR